MAWIGSKQPATNGEPAPQQQQIKSLFHRMLDDAKLAKECMNDFAQCASKLTLTAQNHQNSLDKIIFDLTNAIQDNGGEAAPIEQAMAKFVPEQYRDRDPDAGPRES